MSEIPVVKPGRKFQVGMRTIVLLVALIAVWMGGFINRQENRRLEARIKAMEPLAHELVVDDRSRIAIVKMEELWSDDNRWEVYLPSEFRLCLATRDIDTSGMAKIVKNAPVAAGRHQLALEKIQDQDVWRVTIRCDGKELLSVEDPKDWDPGYGSETVGDYSLSTQLPADQPAVLRRCRFSQKEADGVFRMPKGPTSGILIWLERTGQAQP